MNRIIVESFRRLTNARAMVHDSKVPKLPEDWVGKAMDRVQAVDSSTLTCRVLEFASANLQLLLKRRDLLLPA